jgi:hypothetical protein
MQTNTSSSISATSAAQSTQNKETDSNKALSDSKKALTDIMKSDSVDAKTKEKLQKAIDNIDENMKATGTSATQSSSTKSTESTSSDSEEVKGLKASKKRLSEIANSDNIDARTKDKLQKAIKNIDKSLGSDSSTAESKSDSSKTEQNKNVSNVFDQIKNAMESFAEKRGLTDMVKGQISKMEDFLGSSSDSDTDKLLKLAEMYKESFEGASVGQDGRTYFQDKAKMDSEISDTIKTAKKNIDSDSSGLKVSDKAQKLSSSSESDSSIAKLPFDVNVDKVKNSDLNVDLIKTAMKSRSFFDTTT